MPEQIPGGHFLLSRKIYQSTIWAKHPQYFRLFIWFIGKAVFQDGRTFKGHVLKRGELITTHNEIADALSYNFNRAIIKPTLKEIRIMLSWLQSEGMILMKSLTGGTLPNQGRHQGRPQEVTRAYIGMLITVVNYDTYQDSKNYQGRPQEGTTAGTFPNKGKQEKEGRVNKTFLSDSIEIRLSEILLEKIISRNPNHKKPNIQTWAKDIDLMIRIDRRTPEDIRRVIEWCQADTFWQSNILSTGKLRKQFDQLHAKRGSIGSAPRSSTPVAFSCPRCSRRIVVQSDLTKGGCVYCGND